MWTTPLKGYCVYLIHFDSLWYREQHYTGFSSNIQNRMKCHLGNHREKASKLLWAVREAGIPWQVVWVWPVRSKQEGLKLERFIKSKHNNRNICPICRGETEDIGYAAKRLAVRFQG